jgi:phage terminase large subunit-like protein
VNCAQIVQQYVDGVSTGKVVAGRLQKLAVERYRNDLKRAATSDCPFYFDQHAAECAIEFFPLLTHSASDAVGTPFQLEPDQMFIVWNLIGWKRKANGRRRFKYAHIEAARKWGKTAFAAAFMLLLFLLDGEAKPEIYCVATKLKQSRRAWDAAASFVQSTECIKSLVVIKESPPPTITLADKGVLAALAADGGGADGLFPSGVIFDELHEWRTRTHMKMWGKMRTGSSARPQPLFIVITTAGDDQSKLWQGERDFCVKVLNGDAIADNVFAFILCLDDEDDMFDPSLWPKANPHLGTIANWSDYNDEAAKAQQDPASAREFERYYCNRKVASVTRAISDKVWILGRSPLISLAGRTCHVGVDVGSNDDLSGIGLVFPPLAADGLWYIKAKGFAPAKSKLDLTTEPIASLVKAGLIVVTQGSAVDYQALHASLEETRTTYNLKSLALDPAWASQFGSELIGKKIDVVNFKQSPLHYNEPMREFLRLLAAGKIIHGGCPLLTWCQQNMQSIQSACGFIMPAKLSSAEKVDPLVAVIMAFAEALHFRRELQKKPTGEVVRFL